MDEDKEETAEKVKTPTGWKCAPCHSRFTDRQDYISHMAEQHSKVWMHPLLFKMSKEKVFRAINEYAICCCVV